MQNSYVSGHYLAALGMSYYLLSWATGLSLTFNAGRWPSWLPRVDCACSRTSVRASFSWGRLRLWFSAHVQTF
jgi:hypothetical protein